MLTQKQRVRTSGRIAGAGRSVAMRRVWFADDETNRDDSTQQSGNDAYKPQSLDDALKIIEALSKRVSESKEAAKKRGEEARSLSERLTAIETARQRQLEEQGNFAEIAKQRAAEIEALKPAAERALALERIIRESNEARMARIPEQMRGMVPTDYAPERLQEWLSKNEALLTKPPAPDFGAGAGGSGGARTVALTEEQRQAAKRFGMTEEQYAKAFAKVRGE